MTEALDVARGDLHGRMDGRLRVLTDFKQITRANVVEAVGKANAPHMTNAMDTKYLFAYYRGLQDIRNRRKTVRPDITHNTVVNHAAEIVAFQVSYLMGDPIVYVARNTDRDVTEAINEFNDFMHLAGIQAANKELADDFAICGHAFRYVHPNKNYVKGEDEAPFIVETLDPMKTYVAYENRPSKTPERIFAVTSVYQEDVGEVYDVYTKTEHFVIQKNQVVSVEPNPIGEIPIIEYVNNEFMIGSFEPVLDLLDAANTLESNRIEATEQNVQALTWFNDVDLSDEAIAQLKNEPSAFVFTRTIKDAAQPNIKTIVTDLMQQDQQVLQNDIYKKILTIVGMPVMGDGNTSDSSNNGSTIVRNGWQHAEARAKDTATLWARSDKTFVKIALKICHEMAGELENLHANDIACKFTRQNYEDIQTKATVLTTLLGCDKVHPAVAYQVCGLVTDPEEACRMGLEWYQKQQEDARKAAELQQQRVLQAAQQAREGGGTNDRRYQPESGTNPNNQRRTGNGQSRRAEN